MKLSTAILALVRGGAVIAAGCGGSTAIAFPEKPAEMAEVQVVEAPVAEAPVVDVEPEQFTPDESIDQRVEYENIARPCGRG